MALEEEEEKEEEGKIYINTKKVKSNLNGDKHWRKIEYKRRQYTNDSNKDVKTVCIAILLITMEYILTHQPQ